MARLEREELRVLLLNAKNAVLRAVDRLPGQRLGGAGARRRAVPRRGPDPRRGHLIIVHNHPSGDPEPSPDDLHLTAEAIAAGRLLDIAVLDHVILARATRYVSLRDRGVAFDRALSRAADVGRAQTPRVG